MRSLKEDSKVLISMVLDLELNGEVVIGRQGVLVLCQFYLYRYSLLSFLFSEKLQHSELEVDNKVWKSSVAIKQFVSGLRYQSYRHDCASCCLQAVIVATLSHIRSVIRSVRKETGNSQRKI